MKIVLTFLPEDLGRSLGVGRKGKGREGEREGETYAWSLNEDSN